MEIVILLLFILFAALHAQGIFSRARSILKYRPEIDVKQPSISIVVCAHNEYENLRELIPILQNQTYPDYEIIIVLDRCIDRSNELAIELKDGKTHVLVIEHSPEGIHPKKYGIQQAIDQSKNEWIVLTDADCRPSTDWVTSMSKSMTDGAEIVIGLSPYFKTSGLLNLLIQYETYLTSLYFVSSASRGIPYMGLGRNLAYKKSVFVESGGFGTSASVTGGDDDLLLQRMLNESNYVVSLWPESRVDSIPENFWKSYIQQKTRHLSVGKYYPPKVIRLEMIRWTIHLFFWLLFFINLTISPLAALSILAVTLFIKAISINIVVDRLEKRFNHLWLPFVDLLYVVIFPIISLRSLLVKQIKWN